MLQCLGSLAGESAGRAGQVSVCPMALKEMARVGGGFTPHCPCQGFCSIL